MAQADVVLQLRTAQIQIAVPQPRVLGDVLIVGNRERRRLRLVEDAQLARRALRPRRSAASGSRCRRAALDLADHGDDELGAQPLGALEQRLVAFDDRPA